MDLRRLMDSLSSRFRRKSHGEEAEHAAFMEEMIERVVQTASPKIKAVRGYRKRLHPALDRSARYLEESIRLFQGPVSIRRQAWSTDPLVNACFGSVEQLEAFLRGNTAMREAAERAGCREVHFLLTMSRREEIVYGSTIMGEIIRRDVPQEVVTFSDHRCVAPGMTLQETSGQLLRLALELLASLASASILETRKRREDLERERTSLQYELKILRLKGQGLGSDLAKQGEIESEIDAGQKVLRELDAQIARLTSEFSDLEDYLKLVEGVFTAPESMLRFEDAILMVNRQGVKNYQGTDDPSRPIRFVQFSTSERSRAAFLAVSPRGEILGGSGQ